MKAAYHIEEMKPFGLKFTASRPTDLTTVIDGDALKALVKQYRVVLLRGFNEIKKSSLVDYARLIGSLLEWEFGSVMEMRVHEEPKNYLFTNGPVPFHWDGAFHQTPRYLLFHCIDAPLSECGGETIFIDTHRVWQSANEQEKQEWAQYFLTYETEKLAHYGGLITEKLVQEHPDTQEKILRFAEPVPVTMLNPVKVKIKNTDEETEKMIIKKLTERCYQTQNCYEHTWHENDFLLADNNALLHGRNEFKQFSPRHLRRIQIL